MQINKESPIHPLYLFTMAAFGLIFILISKSLLLSLSAFFLLLSIFFINGLCLRTFLKLILSALIFSFGFFLLSQIYPAREFQDFVLYRIGIFEFYRASLIHGLNQWAKLALLTTLSMTSGVVVDYTKILMSLMQNETLPLRLGYPLILAMNSIVLLSEEMNRIKMLARQRKLPFMKRIFPFFSLMVFAIRHSQRGALALVTRGLNEKKSFYFDYETSKYDRFYLLFYLLLYFTLVSLNFFVLK
jgi:hypothetical protein